MKTIQEDDAAGRKAPAQPPGRLDHNASGMVLVVVVIFATAACILATGLYFASGSRIKQVRQEMRFEKAFFVAESGVENAKAALRANPTNLNTVLFGGFTNYGGGRFYVSARTNGGTNNIVIIRATGMVEQATRVLEVQIRLVAPSPAVPGISDGAVCFYGTNTSLYLKNANNHVNGYDYYVPENFTGNGSACDGTLSTNVGAPGVFYSSTNTSITGSGDITGNPPITNWAGIFTEGYWYNFLDTMLPYATMYTTSSAMGTRDAPVITILPSGTTKITGNNDGAGILIVPGGANLSVGGTFHYEGLLIIIGDGVVDTEAEFAATGTFDMFGSVICLGGALNISATGKAAMKYSTEALANLSRLAIPARLADLDVISWKEIKASSADW